MLRLISLLLLVQQFVSTERITKRAPKPINFSLHLPSGGQLTPPTGLTLQYLTVGAGQQIYKCQKGKWASMGAKAKLYDLSSSPESARTITNDIMKLGKQSTSPPKDFSPDPTLIKHFPVIGTHSFDSQNPNQPLPEFEINHERVTANRMNAAPSPLHPGLNVQWLQLKVVSGSLASMVFRTTTRAGVPKSNTCSKEGDQLGVNYAALYSFWK